MTRRISLAVALLGGVGLAVVCAPPAAAHEEGWTAGWRVEQDVTFTEPPVVSFSFTHDGPPTQPGIEQVAFTVALVAEGGVPEGCTPATPEPLKLDPRREDSETLAASVPLTVPCNGRHTVTVVASTAANAVHAVENSPPITLAFEAAVPPPPPSDVEAELTEVDGAAAARVTWRPPASLPPDLVGYVVARSRSANDGFEVVGESVEPELVDPGASEGGVFHYRVHSVRLGARSDLISSEATPSVSVDVPAPATTTDPATTAPPVGARPSGDDRSGFGTLQQEADRLRPPPQPQAQPPDVARTPTTVDGGFAQTLPFDPEQPTTTTTVLPATVPDGSLTASEIFEEGEPSDRKAVVAPVAGALALLVGFLQLRWLLRQASTA